MSDQNLRHWDVLSRTDPRHTKPFQRAGGFRGTATKPIWIEMRLTEHFGPCGIGWGCDAPQFNLVPAGEELLVFCTLRCWYMDGEARAEVYGVGGDKVLVKQQSGLRSDDEAYKKAFTDALGNAFKHVGSNADVHMGLFEDSKYVAELRREFAEDDAPAADPEPSPRQAKPAQQPMPPANPEEPPDVAEARREYTRIMREFNAALDEQAVTAVWQANTLAVQKIKRYGGESAMAMLNDVAQKRLDAIRGGAAA